MDGAKPIPTEACGLDAVIATAQLATRSRRKPNPIAETQALVKLHHELAADPKVIFQKLVQAALQLSSADSTGISLLNEETKRFIWPAVAGPFYVYLWEGTPSDFGPCGAVIDRQATQLMLHPERHFTYLQSIQPGLSEVLLVPFLSENKIVGTLWAVIHEDGRHFDGEDQRLLESLSDFASSAYETLLKAGSLEPLLCKPSASSPPKARSCAAAKNSPRHQCMIYEGAPSNHLASIAETLSQRLKANYRCLYLNSRPMVAGLRCHLSASGLDLQEEVRRGALILSSDQGHLIDGKFDTPRMVAALHDSLQRALADGFAGLWAAGDMTWEFGNEVNLAKLLEYERELENFMETHPELCGVCLYHRDTLPAHAIQTARETHRAVYVNATLTQLNPLYL